MNILNISETYKGGIGTYFNSIRLSSNNMYFISPDCSYSEYKLDSKLRFVKLTLLLIYTLMYISKNKVDVIFMHSTYAGLLRVIIYPICLIKGIKLVYCSHGWAYDSYMGYKVKFIILLERFLSLFCNAIVCISNSDFSSAIKYGFDNDKLTIINNGVEPLKNDLYNFKNVTTLNEFLFVGRLDKQKGLSNFVELVELMSLQRKVKLTVIGSPVLNQTFDWKTFFETPRSNIIIKHIDWVDNNEIDKFYSKADVTIVPSLWEGFGLVVPESFRNGTPCLVSNVGELKSMVESNCGWSFDYNDPLSLETLIRDLLGSEIDFSSMSYECKKRFENLYSANVMRKSYEKFFEELV